MVCSLLLAGCQGPWRPPAVSDDEQSREVAHAPADYLKNDLVGQWVYERRDLIGQDAEPALYSREVRNGRLAEGVFMGRSILPLEDYLQTGNPDGGRPAPPLEENEWAVFFELDPPLDPFPSELPKGQGQVTETVLRYYNRAGHLQGRGTLRRTAVFEGFEDIQTQAGFFENCLRMRVDLRIHFPWIMSMDWTTYRWLSIEAGEVRRIERYSGMFFVLYFRSAYEYLLVSSDVARAPEAESPLPRFWEYGLYGLERGLPRPRLSGLVVDSVAAHRPSSDTEEPIVLGSQGTTR